MALPETITFVTGNPGKATELQHLLAPHGITVAQDERGYPEIQADTLEEVAHAGADHLLAQGLPPPFLLEDAGLWVAALQGFPGVYSRHALDTIGCAGILRLLEQVEHESRTAVFQAFLLYVDAAGQRHGFLGRSKGRIAPQAAGDGGFGFDPIFCPAAAGSGATFAELSPEEKGAISHRGAAAQAFLAHLLNE